MEQEPVRSEACDTIWSYCMRRDMQEIIPGLYLGPYSSAIKSKAENLQNFGITHIVCVRQDIEAHFIRPNFPDKFQYLVLELADSVTTNIIPFLPKAKRFIDECFSQGGKVLVHGNGGISRSAALVIAYIMESLSLSYKEACALVQRKRFCVKPNDGFSQQLKEYEPIYKANKQMLQEGQTSQATGTLKRRFDEADGSDGENNVMDCVYPSDS